MSNYQFIDLDYLHKMASGDVDFMKELITDYLEKEPSNFQLLTDAYQVMHFVDMKYYAHKLRSSVQIVGAKKLLEKLERIEHLAAVQDASLALEFDDIAAINAQVILELKQELDILQA
jgi:HPt (histidine-containing phosphotransfer) domain-containing protein